jgi:hypothetical protein
MNLRQLYDTHTGKVSDKWALYLDAYERTFAPWRDRELTLVEVGVQNGGSLEIWSRYFPRARMLVGCDIDPRCSALRYEDPRVAVVVGSANAPEVQDAILDRVGDIDIFIDDGSHHSADIVASFWNYFPFVRPGGLYVIEDLHCAYFPQWGGGLDRQESAMAFLKRLADAVNFMHWRGQRSLEAVFEPFAPADTAPDVRMVEHVLAVTFLDSLCVVEKRASDVPPGLRERVIAGREAAVQPKVLALRDAARGS